MTKAKKTLYSLKPNEQMAVAVDRLNAMLLIAGMMAAWAGFWLSVMCGAMVLMGGIVYTAPAMAFGGISFMGVIACWYVFRYETVVG